MAKPDPPRTKQNPLTTKPSAAASSPPSPANAPSVPAIEELLPDDAAIFSMTHTIEAFINAHPDDWTETRTGAAWLEILEAMETLREATIEVRLAVGVIHAES